MNDLRPRSAALAASAGILALTAGGGCPAVAPEPRADPPDTRLGERALGPLSPDELRHHARFADRGVIPGVEGGGESALLPLVAPPGAETAALAWWQKGDRRDAIRFSARPPEPGLRILSASGRDGVAADPGARAATWGGLDLASRALGAELGKLAFSIEGADGAPLDAEAALAGGFAAVAGEEFSLRDDVAAFGVAAIDGSLLPAAETAERAAAALERGAREVGAPEPAAERAGVAPAATAAEGIALLTGERPPEPDPVPRSAMRLTEPEHERAALRYDTLRRRLASVWPRIVRLRDQAPLPAALDELVAAAYRQARLAEEARTRDEIAAAFARASRALSAAETAADTWRYVEAIRERDVEGARRALGRHRAHRDRAGASPFGEFEFPPERRRAQDAVQAGAAAIRASIWGERADAGEEAASAYAAEAAELPRPDRRGAEVTRGAALAALPVAASAGRAGAELARAELLAGLRAEISADPGGGGRADPARLGRYATAIAAIGDAKRAGAEAAAAAAASPSPRRETSKGAAEIAQGGAAPARALAAALAAYVDGWILAAEAAALDLELDEHTGRILSLRDPELIDSLLPLAERRARIHARAAAVITGAIPAAVKLDYLRARELEREAGPDRARALFSYWRASAGAQTAASLALR